MQQNNGDSFDKLRSIKQAYEALETRGEGERAFFEKIPVIGNFFKSASSLHIENAAANLNKHFGVSVIDKNNDNATNRAALRNFFNFHVNGILDGIQEKARKEANPYSQYKIFETKIKLLSMPIREYDDKGLYNLVDSLNDLGNEVTRGLPVGMAINSSNFIKKVENNHRGYVDRQLARQYDLYDNSINSFLKGALTGSAESAAGIADSILNFVSMRSLSSNDHKTVVLDAVRRILPDITPEEERGLLTRTGREIGSFASAVAWFGVPKTATEAAKFIAIPKGIELMTDVLGVPRPVVDTALGALNTAIAVKHTRGIYSGLKAKFSYPDSNGGINTEYPSLKNGKLQERVLDATNEKVSSLHLEEQVKYSDTISEYDNQTSADFENGEPVVSAQNPADLESTSSPRS